jgi:hypothetical protein
MDFESAYFDFLLHRQIFSLFGGKFLFELGTVDGPFAFGNNRPPERLGELRIWNLAVVFSEGTRGIIPSESSQESRKAVGPKQK